MRSACAALNMAALVKESNSPTELFANVLITPNLKDAHVFGCPAYVLNNWMQAGGKIPKWEERSRVRVYLGPSRAHARSIGLILSLTTGLVSPQFHVHYGNSLSQSNDCNHWTQSGSRNAILSLCLSSTQDKELP